MSILVTCRPLLPTCLEPICTAALRRAEFRHYLQSPNVETKAQSSSELPKAWSLRTSAPHVFPPFDSKPRLFSPSLFNPNCPQSSATPSALHSPLRKYAVSCHRHHLGGGRFCPFPKTRGEQMSCSVDSSQEHR